MNFPEELTEEDFLLFLKELRLAGVLQKVLPKRIILDPLDEPYNLIPHKEAPAHTHMLQCEDEDAYYNRRGDSYYLVEVRQRPKIGWAAIEKLGRGIVNIKSIQKLELYKSPKDEEDDVP